jgi:hypothetical protein
VAVSTALAPAFESDVDITGVAVATSTSVALAPASVVAGTGASITSGVAACNAAALAPATILAEENVTITAPIPAQAVAAALLPSAVFSEATISSTLAVAMAISPAPAVTADTNIVVGEVAQAASTALAPTAVTAGFQIWLTATATGNTTINLDWDEPYGALVGYDIERGGLIIQDTYATSSDYPDTGLTAATEYCYRVRGVHQQGVSI